MGVLKHVNPKSAVQRDLAFMKYMYFCIIFYFSHFTFMPFSCLFLAKANHKHQNMKMFKKSYNFFLKKVQQVTAEEAFLCIYADSWSSAAATIEFWSLMDQQAKEWGHIGECGPLPAGTVPSDGAPSIYSEHSTFLIGRRPRKRTNKTMKKREKWFQIA